eukprot:TRINITY_DN35369_c0_g1_i1.p1 TRINITY_DN35369_c0_g1~~TRINITY_DN35369_c0_g1_i1.p1  ORF type:complete len:1270 (-),score=187.84 TRINITY_DN35369_c0_g1_i1:140-3949(-)
MFRFGFFAGASSGDGGAEAQAAVKPGASSATATGDDGLSRERLARVCLEYSPEELEVATNGFHEKRLLGSGGAGTVYRGTLKDGSSAAIKVIDLAALGADFAMSGFEEEVAVLSKFRHPNLVVLMGWARKGHTRYLVYEYLEGGDVSVRLRRCKEGSHGFTWQERINVAIDAATGLAHLHNAAPEAFHRDVKPPNILLSPSAAKVADFGLSCVADQGGQSSAKGGGHQCELPSGTPGYSCPHYIATRVITQACEVYSFGIVLLQLLLNVAVAVNCGGIVRYPVEEMIAPAQPGAVERIVAALDPSAGWPAQIAIGVARLAIACVDLDDERRPVFNQVCRGLRSLRDMPLAYTAVPGPSAARGFPPASSYVHGVALAAQAPQPGLIAGVPFAPAQLLPKQSPAQHFHLPREPSPAPPARQAPFAVCAARVQSPAPRHPPAPLHSLAPSGDPAGDCIVSSKPADATLFVEARVLAPPQEAGNLHVQKTGQLPLVANVDPNGRRVAQIGRQHQYHGFEQLLGPELAACLSRTVCELIWSHGMLDGHQDDLPVIASVLGSSPVLVDGVVVRPEMPRLLRPTSQVTLASQEGCSLVLIAAASLAFPREVSPPFPPRALTVAPPVDPLFPAANVFGCIGAAAAKAPGFLAAPAPTAVPAPPSVCREAKVASTSCMWRFDCVEARGFSDNELAALPVQRRSMVFACGDGMPPAFLGRLCQPELFEAVLSRNPALVTLVSRNHLRLETTFVEKVQSNLSSARVLLTNLSQNPVIVGGQHLVCQGGSIELCDGSNIAFAEPTQPAPGIHDCSTAFLPFLRFRAVACADPLAASGAAPLPYPAPVGQVRTSMAEGQRSSRLGASGSLSRLAQSSQSISVPVEVRVPIETATSQTLMSVLHDTAAAGPGIVSRIATQGALTCVEERGDGQATEVMLDKHAVDIAVANFFQTHTPANAIRDGLSTVPPRQNLAVATMEVEPGVTSADSEVRVEAKSPRTQCAGGVENGGSTNMTKAQTMFVNDRAKAAVIFMDRKEPGLCGDVDEDESVASSMVTLPPAEPAPHASKHSLAIHERNGYSDETDGAVHELESERTSTPLNETLASMRFGAICQGAVFDVAMAEDHGDKGSSLPQDTTAEAMLERVLVNGAPSTAYFLPPARATSEPKRPGSPQLVAAVAPSDPEAEARSVRYASLSTSMPRGDVEVAPAATGSVSASVAEGALKTSGPELSSCDEDMGGNANGEADSIFRSVTGESSPGARIKQPACSCFRWRLPWRRREGA